MYLQTELQATNDKHAKIIEDVFLEVNALKYQVRALNKDLYETKVIKKKKS